MKNTYKKTRAILIVFAIVIVIAAALALAFYFGFDKDGKQIYWYPGSIYVSNDPEVTLTVQNDGRIVGKFDNGSVVTEFEFNSEQHKAFFSYGDTSGRRWGFASGKIELSDDGSRLIISSMEYNSDSTVDFGTDKLVFERKDTSSAPSDSDPPANGSDTAPGSETDPEITADTGTSLDPAQIEWLEKEAALLNSIKRDDDGALVIPSFSDEPDNAFPKAAHLIGNGDVPLSENDVIKADGITLEVSTEREDDSNLQFVFVETINARGQRIELAGEDRLYLTGNGLFQAFDAGEYSVVAFTSYGNGCSYVINKDGYVKVDGLLKLTDDVETCSDIIFLEIDGELGYRRTAHKFGWRKDQVVGGIMELCVARDELYREYGKAEILDGKIVYTPQKTVTVSEGFDIEKEYSLWQEACRDSDDHNLDGLTLDEYLSQNAGEHPRAH
ncbi:MAG: hypothetical protein IJR90_06180 [Clostridia bacterium]|nr:hypothetical protein [Clostridia bacterium]